MTHDHDRPRGDYVPPQDRTRPGGAHEAMYPLFLVVRTAPARCRFDVDSEDCTRVTLSLLAGVHEAHLATGLHPGTVDHPRVINAVAEQLRAAAKAAATGGTS
jgi:hypothetical protein